MGLYVCRLIDPEGQETGLVPVIGSSLMEAKLTARTVYQTLGSHGSYEIWSDTTRLVAHAELEALPQPPEVKPVRRVKRRDTLPLHTN